LSVSSELGRRERTKAANRAAILVAARDVFVELGYGAASVRDIVRRTDLASGTFYNYFPDKESVFRAVVEDTAREAADRAHVARQRGTTLEAFITDGFRCSPRTARRSSSCAATPGRSGRCSTSPRSPPGSRSSPLTCAKGSRPGWCPSTTRG
jgi:AcrR family transcriptional regulator